MPNIDETTLVINPGDTITITIPGLITATVTVDSAVNWNKGFNGRQSDWYIEGHSVDTGLPHYWKQGSDGGHITYHKKGK